jgi:hypothetical protein
MLRSVPTQRSAFLALAGLITAGILGGCASEKLDKAAPAGVNLSGDWKFNPNLSDDADKLTEKDEKPAPTPSGHHGHSGGRGGGAGGGGMPPVGSTPDGYDFTSTSPNGSAADGYGFLPVALAAPGIEQSTQLPPVASAPPSNANTRGASISRFLKAPMTMSIIQKDGVVSIHAIMSDGATTADDFVSGNQPNIPYSKDQTADRTVGWRGPVFVVTVQVKKSGFREDDFAIDEDDGRLIMTTLTKGGKIGKVEIKRVYDRMRGAAR